MLVPKCNSKKYLFIYFSHVLLHLFSCPLFSLVTVRAKERLPEFPRPPKQPQEIGKRPCHKRTHQGMPPRVSDFGVPLRIHEYVYTACDQEDAADDFVLQIGFILAHVLVSLDSCFLRSAITNTISQAITSKAVKIIPQLSPSILTRLWLK